MSAGRIRKSIAGQILGLGLVLGLVVSSLFSSSCHPSSREGDYFFVEHKDSIMPVWVKGNIESGTCILFIHGGPGDSGIFIGVLGVFEQLEESVCMIYYDQRLSGTSQGNIDIDTLTPEQFVEDLDVIIEVVRDLYDDPDLFLMGHSWGGFVGTSYLLDAEREKKIKGWIEVDGSHDLAGTNALSREWMIDFATEKIAADESPVYWRAVLKFYQDHPVITVYELLEHIGYLGTSKAYYFDTDNAPNIPINALLTSPFSIFGLIANGTSLLRNLETPIGEALFAQDLSPRMGAITLPSLFIWGRHDGVVPVETGELGFASIGTPDEQKTLEIFERSGHVPMEEESDKFTQVVLDFLGRVTP